MVRRLFQVLAHTLSVGSFVMFTTYMAMLVRPISSLGRVVNLVQRGMASVGRIFSVFGEVPGIEPPAEGSDFSCGVRSRCAILLDKVSVYYGPLAALQSVNLEVPAGATVAILGTTGSGKSALVRLHARMIDPSQGAILVDGVDCRELPLAALRSMVGVVPQETFLFSVTLAENISLGTPDASESNMRQPLRLPDSPPIWLRCLPATTPLWANRGIMLWGDKNNESRLPARS